jgi:CRP/FNR family cyclic AMP-dependent transcriptional regulator
VDRGETTSFLGGLSAADLTTLRAHARAVSFAPGDVIMREGDQSSTVLVVLEGTVKATKLAATGREVVLELRGPGEVVGELGVIDGHPRSASVVALDRVDALVLSARAFHEVLREHADIAHRLLVTIVGRLRQASSRQLELGTIDVVGRVCNRLVELAMTHGEPVANGILVRSAISQHELADWVGVSRDGVVRALRELRELGWVETGRRRVVVVNLGALRQRAGS